MRISKSFYALSLCSIVPLDTVLNVFVINNKVHVYFQNENGIYKTTWKPPRESLSSFITEMEYKVSNINYEKWTEPELIFENSRLLDTTKFSVSNYKLALFNENERVIYVYGRLRVGLKS